MLLNLAISNYDLTKSPLSPIVLEPVGLRKTILFSWEDIFRTDYVRHIEILTKTLEHHITCDKNLNISSLTDLMDSNSTTIYL